MAGSAVSVVMVFVSELVDFVVSLIELVVSLNEVEVAVCRARCSSFGCYGTSSSSSFWLFEKYDQTQSAPIWQESKRLATYRNNNNRLCHTSSSRSPDGAKDSSSSRTTVDDFASPSVGCANKHC